MKIHFSGEYASLLTGLSRLADRLDLHIISENHADAVTLAWQQREGPLEVEWNGQAGIIRYEKNHHAFRAFGLWAEKINTVFCNMDLQQQSFSICETPQFQSVGTLFDVSRNAVPTVKSIQSALVTLSLMGINQVMLYTEDTYEVDEYPYFGYMRGRYSQQELREIDDFAYEMGIEAIPCIQTLAHLTEALKWNYAAEIKDTSDILLVGKKETYTFIEHMIRSASSPFRTKRIHIGMDEAHQLGLGKFLKHNGYQQRFKLMNDHLQHVLHITERLGLDPMIWSDMYFHQGPRNGELYEDDVIPMEALKEIPEGISLMYWDYYHTEQDFYESSIQKHFDIGRPLIFAGGVWTWNGLAPNMGKMLSTTIPALQACKNKGVQEVVATMWGDNGAETPWMAAWFGLQLYAEYAYAEAIDEGRLESRFRFCTGGEARDFLNLGLFDETPGVEPGNGRESNPSKFLLWQDVLIGLYDANIAGIPLEDHYRDLAERLEVSVHRNPNNRHMFEWYRELAKVLSKKCTMGLRLKTAYEQKQRPVLEQLKQEIQSLIPQMNRLRQLHQKLWFQDFKPFGWEVIDMRYGSILIRLQSTVERMEDYLQENVKSLPELEVERLPFDDEWGFSDGTLGRGTYHQIVSANCMFNPA
ncbi:hypothetical protein J2Z69_001039 [Paenibacillus shirakamiensis]|uniref:Beta-N-acetylhexosaminidase n=1 Tax=Paenibacillus shirakamiensis TaxID=1265935 RepID=A0ABS4JG25_9BACL|nr:beta-N-acetylhexosaminidase [Paenibacillus shirakamiensis]MBP2000020.1 hypothetical protein [Paenibacillus shirakamiensis]